MAPGNGTSNTVKKATAAQSATSSLSDGINLQVIHHLQATFKAADADGSGQLDEEEFVAAFKGVIGVADRSDEKALCKLFMQIDANCDGSVDWEEFSAYLLLDKNHSGANSGSNARHYAGSSTYSTKEVKPLPPGVAHKDLVTGLMHVDSTRGPDRWYSAGRDGTIRVWNGQDLAHVRTYQTGLQATTCCAYLPCSELLAIGSYGPAITLLESTTGKQAGRIAVAASNAILSMCGWRDAAGPFAGEAGNIMPFVGRSTGTFAGWPASAGRAGRPCSAGSTGQQAAVPLAGQRAGRELLGVGDADGGVGLAEVKLDEVANRKSNNRYYGKQLWRSVNHHDWVVAVLLLPQLNSILAASLDKTLTMTDVERRITVKTLAGHHKSVTCCAWNGMYKMAISGGADRTVMLWNTSSCRPLGSFVGHTAPLVGLAVNEKHYQVVSAAEDKIIKVWDVRNQRCIQTLTDRTYYSPEDTIAAIAFSPSRQLLVTAADQPRPWPLAVEGGKGPAAKGHRHPISWIKYSTGFKEAVSTDQGGTVCLWHITTGELRFAFDNAHGDCRITTAAFDGSYRRLVTGADDGTIKVWNYRSGSLLSAAETSSSEGSEDEVTGLVVVNNANNTRTIIATGWDRKVTLYDDNGSRLCAQVRSSSGPTNDILAAAIMQGYPTLATACYDGEVWLWNLESGAVRRRLTPATGYNAHQGSVQNLPVERVAFMTGSFRHVLVAVGGDCVMRFWDCVSGHCLLEQYTGHVKGESVVGLVLSPDNSAAVTADTAGYIMVWDLSRLCFPAASKANKSPAPKSPGGQPHAAVSRPQSTMSKQQLQAAASAQQQQEQQLPQADAVHAIPSGQSPVQAVAKSQNVSMPITRLAVWRAHCEAVTALEWVPPPSVAAAAAAAKSMRLSRELLDEQPSNAVRGSTATNRDTGQEADNRCALISRAGSCDITIADFEQGSATARRLSELPSLATPGQHWQQRPSSAAAAQQRQPVPATATQHQQQEQHGIGPPTQLPQQHSGFILSASLDGSLAVWSSAGGLVGLLGRHGWDVESISTWQSPAIKPLQEHEQQELQQSSCHASSLSARPTAAAQHHSAGFPCSQQQQPQQQNSKANGYIVGLESLQQKEQRQQQERQQQQPWQSSIAEEDIPSSLWLPQFNCRTPDSLAAAKQQQQHKQGAENGIRIPFKAVSSWTGVSGGLQG